MSVIKDVGKILDAALAQEGLASQLGGNADIVKQGLVLTNAVLSYIALIKEEIVRANEVSAAKKRIFSKLEKVRRIIHKAGSFAEDDWEGYEEYIRKRAEAAREALKSIREGE
ncbi:hypothetical protein F0310_04440 (plasmid) [Borrelia sp. A-FGy1]|uniref:hypothetical protein n=1 Tax=Borrelia sp. A-FGy1 TaxID=2608247 RepID=UPI0015F5B475|nr:hypothetical protein [Borrelia sp. A-FGy1]QMU99662.1 hypothetical protein F0310_04440 [Borrelia sp. A-FGy1]